MGLKVFYFIATMGARWRQIVDEQLATIERSGLYDAAEAIYVCQTTKAKIKLPEKYQAKYFSRVEEFEYPAFHMVKEFTQPGDKILYLHTKGASRTGSRAQAGDRWREYLMWGCVERWREHVAALDACDVSGVQLTTLNDEFAKRCGARDVFAGNFWWATADYLDRLTPPEITRNRWGAEGWIMGESPRCHDLHNLTGGGMITEKNTFALPDFGRHEYDPKSRKKIGMTLLVRDEADIIDEWMDQHIGKADCIIITDNGSTDGTREKLASWKERLQERIEIIDEPAHDFNQPVWVDRMIRRCIERGCDWVANSDADEFWHAGFQQLAASAPAGVGGYRIRSRLHVRTVKDDLNAASVADRHPWYLVRPRDKSEAMLIGAWNKIFHRLDCYRMNILGNHAVEFTGKETIVDADPSAHIIEHFSERSWEHYSRKYRQGGAAYRNNPLPYSYGFHWKDRYRIYEEGGIEALRAEYDRTMAREFSKLARS